MLHSVMGGLNVVSQGFKRLFALILGIVLTFVHSCTSRMGDCEVIDALRSQLQDWPALLHYREANGQLPPPPKTKLVLCSLGIQSQLRGMTPKSLEAFSPASHT